ncbi:MAG: Methyltransferase type 11 [Frankiales bacterium]|nr:Methyltransferase type 11 [Frankiales bacterium]
MGAYAEVVNTDQEAAWDGHEGDVWSAEADRYDRSGSRLLRRFFEAQPVGRADRVLDVGCGTGKLTRTAAAVASDGRVTGIDLSSKMLELARQRSASAGLDNVSFHRADAQVVALDPGSFDLAISSFGVMFFNDPVAAFSNIGSALRPGGRLALLAWRSLPENAWLMSLREALAMGRDLPMPPPEAPTPFSLADPERVRVLLGSAGFEGVELTPIDEDMDMGADAADALVFARSMGIVEGLTDGLDAAVKAEAMDNLARLFKEHETADGVLLGSAAWLITAARR